ncbi:MAG: hypothetical protein LBL72_02165 [Candidatus Accumulibacter sp.]|jgi:hypothetical protein|nr:hypothetical protein [Accumulibacter sp.]
MKTFASILFVSFVSFASIPAAFARAPEPIVDYPAVEAVTLSGKALSVGEVTQAIQEAAKAAGWAVTKQENGKLIARRTWKNGKHSIFSEITPNKGGYSLVYKHSVNMGYTEDGSWSSSGEGGYVRIPSIHPFYNRYVRDLNEAIRNEFLNH